MKFVLALIIGTAAAAPSIQSTAEHAAVKFLDPEPGVNWGVYHSNGVGKGVQTDHSSVANIDEDKAVDKRESDPHLVCDVGGTPPEGPLVDVVKELGPIIAGMEGNCTVGPGPGVCSRIYCKDSAAVWICNDNTHAIEPECCSLASEVERIANFCPPMDTGNGRKSQRGQSFMEKNMNIIVGSDPGC
ncbi:hypothetical protein GGR53DRAFT_464095 [Hypoxylon sp. FL1150]|nr:hypothetical protein GGR53DRAFT_464095 [Hypoxylon sp. FL1150]